MTSKVSASLTCLEFRELAVHESDDRGVRNNAQRLALADKLSQGQARHKKACRSLQGLGTIVPHRGRGGTPLESATLLCFSRLNTLSPDPGDTIGPNTVRRRDSIFQDQRPPMVAGDVVNHLLTTLSQQHT